MSITVDGVKFNNKPKNRRLLFIILGVFEFILTVFLVITLAANVLMPEKAMAVEGVSNILSYQGRLTDASGNALGGTGTNYCFRFSIYDDAAVGGTDNELWPSGTPSDNIVNVVSGVFNVGIGEVDNLGTFNFATNTTVYLNVEAATYSGGVCGSYDNLAPRQRIDAVAYARVAHDLYGGQVRIGTGTEGGSPKLLYLDVKNISDTIGGACSINGTIWYNSNNTRALVCNDGVIMAFGSPATTTIVAVKEQGATSAISSGTVNLSGADNITISQDGQTLKFYGAAGGTSGGISGIGASNATATSGTVVFSNSNNVSFGMDGNTITASAGVAGGGIAGIGASNTIFTNGTVVFSGGNNITVGTDDQKIIISAANQSVQTQNLHNVTLGGNTLGAMAQISSGTMTLAGGDNVTLSQDGNAITIIGASGGGGNYAGINGAITGGSLTVNTSGVSINLPDYLTTAMASNAGVRWASNDSQLRFASDDSQLRFTSNDSQLQFTSGMSNYQTAGNYLTTAMASNAGSNFVGLNSAMTGGSLTANSSGISINLPAYLTTAAQSTQTAQVLGSYGNISLVGASGGSLSTNASTISIGIATSYLTSFQQTSGMGAYQATSIGNVGGIAGSAASTVTGGTVVFSNLNNVSFGLNVSTMTASVPAGATATGNLGGLAVSNVASTFTSGTVQFSGSNLISIGTAAGPAIVISNLLSSATTVSAVASANAIGAMASRFALEGHQHAGVAAMGVSGAASTAGNTQTTFGSWYFMPGGNITLSQVTGAGGVHTLSIQGGGGGGGFGVSNIGNFLGNTGTKDLGTFVLSGQANITLSQITDVGGVHTIGISAPNPGGGGGVTLSRWEIPDAGMLTGTAISSHAANSWWFSPFYLQQPLSISNIWVMKSLNVSTVISSNSSGRQSYSYSHGVTIFTRQDWAANSTRLSYLTTGSFGLSFSRSHTGSNNSISAAWVTNSVGGTSSFSTSSNASNWAQFFTGIRQFAIPMVTSFSAGEYFIAHRHSSTTATVNSNATIWFISNVYIAPQLVAFRRMGNSVANMTLSSAMPGGIGFGIASAVTTNDTMPASVISAGTQQYWYANLVNLSIT